ncbi:site-specific integrase [Priestia aryabhattai]|uniref:tyrosine-type recombinase/integrase n=1 Tax=Priestia TaxID=2800373 RepID=UPI001C8F096F|nr:MULTISPECIES: site-specific integrase [Priestia]MBY0005742.1 site-specific integrase [Priestia aryabhattai]MBY0047577.1 site-specific integrase [Priestia aryabhattai]MDH3186685.1 site-specific integrase [Priestia megaterium]
MPVSIEKRGKDSYRFVVSAGFDSSGKRIRKTKTVKASNMREAKKLAAQFEVEVYSGEYIAPEKMLFKAFVEEWRNKYAEEHLSPNTLVTYMLHLKNRIIPFFGEVKLEKIKPLHVLDFLKSLEGEGLRKDGKKGTLSTSTIEYNHRILKNIFNRAVEWQLIKKNPMENIKKPKRIQKETSVYDKVEAELLISCLKKEETMWSVMIKIAITTGLRRGELLGLEWKHIDLVKGTLQVKQALSYVNQKHIIREPKTKNSIRTVSLPEVLVDELKKYKSTWNKKRLKASNLWEGGQYQFLFTSWHGKPLHPSSITTWWRRFVSKHKLRYIRFHDLRHTSATLLINSGVHAKTISSRLGHADIRTTMNIYGHALQEADREATKHFDKLFANNKKRDLEA